MPRGRPPGGPKSPGTGRKKGTPNKRTQEVIEVLRMNGFDPHAPFLYWGRVLKSAMTRAPAKGKADKAERFYQGVITVSDGDAGSHVEEVWNRASADMALSAAGQLAQYIAPKRSAVKVEYKKPHDMTDDELNAAIAAALKGADA